MHKRFISKIAHSKNFLSYGKDLYQTLKDFMSGATPEDARYILRHSEELKKQISAPIKFVFYVIAITLGFFVVWGGLAPLDSAVIAPGYIVLSNNRQAIQHKEGGIIDKLLVKDGEFVEKSQPLVILNDINENANMQINLSSLRVARASEQRLLAEKSFMKEIDFSDPIFDTTIPEVQDTIKRQQELFISKSKAYFKTLEIYKQKIIELEEQKKGFEASLRSDTAQYKSAKEQFQSFEALFKKGYVTKYDLLSHRKHLEELEGRIGEDKAHISQIQQTIVENELNILKTEYEYQQQIDQELKEVHATILDTKERYRAAQDAFHRTVIRAPVSGIVTGIRYHTVGAVVGGGAMIMEVTPQDDQLIVEAQVMPQDIESIHAGLKAKVQLDAFKTRLVPRIEGKVIYVSADRIDDKNGLQPGQQPYYIAQVEIPQQELDNINYDIKLQPGMPAEVFIIKGERTFLQYLMSPLIDTFHKAFKEK